jgi:exopolysaccharide biosynthesis polyprenyl glycosylphosphotransferase
MAVARHPMSSLLARFGVLPYLVVTDLLALLLAVLLTPFQLAPLFVGLTMLLLVNSRLYAPRLSYSILDHLPAITGRILVAGALIICVDEALDLQRGRPVAAAAATAAALVVGARAVQYEVVRRVRRSGLVAHRTLLVGGGQLSASLAQNLLAHPEYGILPVGFIDDDPLLGEGERPVPHLGANRDLIQVIRRHEVQNVIVAFGCLRESTAVDVLRECDRLACEIFFVPRLYEMHAVDSDMELAWDIPLVRLRRAAFRTRRWQLKRVMDVVGAAFALVLFAPVMAACALAVRLETRAPVLFRQSRVGLDGRAFTVLKFRSLTPVDDDESASNWSVADDSRIGPVGRFLRRTSLDELPQLWNVLVGDMSLVGPRPERPYFVTEFTARFPRYLSRHRVPAGVTGWAQVHGLRGDTSIGDRAQFDNFYIENWSLWGDVKIMLRTFVQVFRGGPG